MVGLSPLVYLCYKTIILQELCKKLQTTELALMSSMESRIAFHGYNRILALNKEEIRFLIFYLRKNILIKISLWVFNKIQILWWTEDWQLCWEPNHLWWYNWSLIWQSSYGHHGWITCHRVRSGEVWKVPRLWHCEPKILAEILQGLYKLSL